MDRANIVFILQWGSVPLFEGNTNCPGAAYILLLVLIHILPYPLISENLSQLAIICNEKHFDNRQASMISFETF